MCFRKRNSEVKVTLFLKEEGCPEAVILPPLNSQLDPFLKSSLNFQNLHIMLYNDYRVP